jgi:hypothetical protein
MRCFWQLEGKELGDYVGLVESFVLQSRCLDLVDMIAKNENYELTKALTEYER